jgi:hypothetical protein
MHGSRSFLRPKSRDFLRIKFQPLIKLFLYSLNYLTHFMLQGGLEQLIPCE